MYDPAETLRRAQSLSAGGRFSEAVPLLRQAATHAPDNPTIFLLLGLACQGAGSLRDAVVAYEKSLSLKPDHAEAWARLGCAHQQLKETESAARAYERALQLAPGFAALACNLGGVLLELGRTADAGQAFRQALVHAPDLVEAHNGLGIALKNKGELAAAADAFREALRLRPGYVEAQYNLGNTFHALGRWADAVAAYKAIRASDGLSVEALNNLGVALWHRREFSRALEIHCEAVRKNPAYAPAHLGLGNDLLALNQPAEAIAAFERAAALQPGNREALCNLGNAFLALNRVDDALAAYHRATGNSDATPDLLYNVALAHLVKGDFENGLPGYEHRWSSGETGLRHRGFSQPQWRGEDIAGRTILLHAEQGLGDTFQFIRYVPLVREKGARVILRVQSALKSFLARQLDVPVFASDEPLPPFDVHCPLLSLPLAFGTRLETIPARGPYLGAREDRIAAWRARLGPAGKLKIGLVCSGNPAHRNDHNRSIPLTSFAPLAAIAGGPLHLVQKDLKPTDATALVGGAFIDHSAELHDFEETAALLASLDLLISVDTSAAHLAGALGRPTWLLLPFSPDWRWLLDRPDNPWYPTLRLFRQSAPRDWASVLETIARGLGKLAAQPSTDSSHDLSSGEPA